MEATVVALSVKKSAQAVWDQQERERERGRAQVGMSSFLSAFSAASKIFPVKLSLYYLSADSLYTETYSERVKNLWSFRTRTAPLNVPLSYDAVKCGTFLVWIIDFYLRPLN